MSALFNTRPFLYIGNVIGAAEQLHDAGNISWRRMFGEYGWYCNEKFLGVICDEMDGYFDYVVQPLEGFWWQDGVLGVDYAHKENFHWISLIRLPEFVTKEEFAWVIQEAGEKKQVDFSKVEFFTYQKGACVQCMHMGPYDDEPETVRKMQQYAEEQGYELDISDRRYHREIYLSDAQMQAGGPEDGDSAANQKR